MSWSYSRVSYTVGAVLMCGVLASCNASEPDTANPYAAEFDQGMETTSNELVREVLSDYTITEAEREEVFGYYGNCLEGYGYTFELLPNGEYEIGERKTVDTRGNEEELFQELAQIEETCRIDHLDPVDILYDAVQSNPKNINFMHFMVTCLVDSGHRERGYSESDFRTDLENQEFVESPEYTQCEQDMSEQ
ncbi:hypothetical protein [Timonella sp. A28]|uniref:hypothetical protein n=1 Tax=Timonella sp. A28 TaxID=3442640 RepID=UPI003EBD9CFD